jgi:Tfp pilus assembly protein PilF
VDGSDAPRTVPAVVDAGTAPADAGTAPVDAATRLAAVDAGTAVDAATANPEEKATELLAQATDALQLNDFARAQRLADASLAAKKSPKAYLVKARALHRQDKIDDALAALAAAEKMTPRSANVYELRGRILWAVGRKEEARQQFELFLEVEATGPRAAQIQRFLTEPR